LGQQAYSAWLQAREEARIREVRDTPVITVLEDPRLPMVGEPRHTLQRGILGGFAGVLLGIMIALLFDRLANIRSMPSERASEFFALAHDALPHVSKRGKQ